MGLEISMVEYVFRMFKALTFWTKQGKEKNLHEPGKNPYLKAYTHMQALFLHMEPGVCWWLSVLLEWEGKDH